METLDINNTDQDQQTDNSELDATVADIQDESTSNKYDALRPQERLESFADAEFAPQLIEALGKIDWKEPTPVQALCLPHTTKGRDLAGFAQTGTGKTGVFLLTVAHRLLSSEELKNPKSPACIILSPTRELAMQIESDAQTIFSNLGIKSLAVFGGVDYEKQAKQLTNGVDVVVATPGRLKDYAKKRIFDLAECKMFICDEADRMFDMGFIEDVEFFLDKIPEDCQKLLFSATTNDSVKELAFEYLNKPEYISASPESMTPENIEQRGVIVAAEQKLQVMIGMLKEHQPKCSIIFTNTKIAAEWLHYKLGHNGLDTDVITGDLPQSKRISLIKRIKLGKVKALIATDVASRGLHISDVTHVYNFDLPDDASNYVHRIGRTARAGASGFAYSLVCDDYGHNLREINAFLGPEYEVATEWYDPKYDAIEDQAGDPFTDETSRLSRARRERSGGASKGDRGKPNSRGGRGERANRGDRGKRSEGRNQKGRGDSNKKRSRPNKKRAGAEHGNKPRQPRNNKNKRGPRPSPAAPREAAAAAAQKQPTSIGGLVSKIVKTLFGR